MERAVVKANEKLMYLLCLAIFDQLFSNLALATVTRTRTNREINGEIIPELFDCAKVVGNRCTSLASFGDVGPQLKNARTVANRETIVEISPKLEDSVGARNRGAERWVDGAENPAEEHSVDSAPVGKIGGIGWTNDSALQESNFAASDEGVEYIDCPFFKVVTFQDNRTDIESRVICGMKIVVRINVIDETFWF